MPQEKLASWPGEERAAGRLLGHYSQRRAAFAEGATPPHKRRSVDQVTEVGTSGCRAKSSSTLANNKRGTLVELGRAVQGAPLPAETSAYQRRPDPVRALGALGLRGLTLAAL